MKKIIFIYVFTIFSTSNAFADTDLWFECGVSELEPYTSYLRYMGRIHNFTKSSTNGETLVSFMHLRQTTTFEWQTLNATFSIYQIRFDVGNTYYAVLRRNFKFRTNIEGEWDGLDCEVSSKNAVIQKRDTIVNSELDKNLI